MITNSSVNGDPTTGSHACVERAGARASSTETAPSRACFLAFYGLTNAHDYYICRMLFSFTALRGVGLVK